MPNLRVSIAGAEKPLPVHLPPEATPQDLQAAIFASSPDLSPSTHRLRLIHAGKLLPLSQTTLSQHGVSENSFIHCAVSDQKPITKPDAPAAAGSPSVPSGAIVVTEDATGETRILLPANTQTVATLRAAGLSENQIIALRFPFLVESEAEDGVRIDLEELEANERMTFVEVEDGAFVDAEEGAWSDYLWGFLLGSFLGFIMLILAMDRSIALSRRWKRGIGLGAVVNIVFGIVMLAVDGPR